MSKEELYKALKIFNREDLTYENDKLFNDFEEYMNTMKQEKAIEVFMSTEDMIKYSKLEQEIERLNNIINKAKIYCEDVIQEHENGEYDVDTVWLAIKEHKENIKSILNILNGDLKNYWRRDKE